MCKLHFTVFKHTVFSSESVLPTEFGEKKDGLYQNIWTVAEIYLFKTALGFPAAGPHLVGNFPAHSWTKYFAYFTLTGCTMC